MGMNGDGMGMVWARKGLYHIIRSTLVYKSKYKKVGVLPRNIDSIV